VLLKQCLQEEEGTDSKYGRIPLFPNFPCRYCNYFHKKLVPKVFSCSTDQEEIQQVILVNTHMVLGSIIERAIENEMIGGLLIVKIIEDTIIISIHHNTPFP
jgi:hypothetical protein